MFAKKKMVDVALGEFWGKNGPQNKKCNIKINFKRTNRIQDDDFNHKGKYFWRERKKELFFKSLF
jgi:hypothetical protein